MLGRVLFAFVWLIIAAGLVLPLYPHPRDAVTSAVTTVSDPVRPVAASDPFGCEDCPAAGRGANCEAECPCDQVLPTAFVPLQEGVSVRFTVSVRQLTPDPAKLPTKLPAI
jgi:hypothetical protein